MSNCSPYVKQFFDELEMRSDINDGHNYKSFLREAVLRFLANESKENAFAVYRAFFDTYRITMPGDSNPFIDLLDILKSYEETAANLIDKQRDHFIHSVNVFISGLCIFTANRHYREAFCGTCLGDGRYPNPFQTKNEEFFYRWGLASLFHDVGYPVEIVGHQINSFIRFVSNADGVSSSIKARIEYENLDELNSIAEVQPKRTFTKTYFDAYESCSYINLLKPVDLLAQRIHLTLGTNLNETLKTLNNFSDTMAKSGSIDHGYYSSVIVLKWYGCLIQKCGYPPEQLYWPVLDSATAILLHNFYRNVLQKPPFNKGPMLPDENPVAYLLILSDEMQEWNREAHGILTRKSVMADTVNLSINDERLEIHYITRHGSLPKDFAREKEKDLRGMLALEKLFPDGVDIDCVALESLSPFMEHIDQTTVPRPLLENLELLAIAIHSAYNRKQKQLFPDQPIMYPHFSDLPDDLKYSNLRQARSMYERLSSGSYVMKPKGATGFITEFPPEELELFAEKEHEDWVNERIQSGWTLGEKNTEKKTTPYLVPYSELSEVIKDYDRDAVRNIPIYADLMGMAVYKDDRN